MKKNLIFLHIAKNGGSTFHTILERVYEKEKVFTIRAINKSGLNTKEFIELPESEKKGIQILKGHMIFGLHKYLHGNSEYITFLRKPLDRIISYYYYVLSRPNHELHKFVTKNNLTLYDFAQSDKLVKRGDFNNAQIKKISGINDKPQIMLEKALENIKTHFPCVGIMERYDESIILFKKYFRLKTAFYQVQNKTKNKESTRNIDKRTIELIIDLNKEDYLLYDEIEKRFDRQINEFGKSKFKFELYSYLLANKLYNQKSIRELGKKVKIFTGKAYL